MNKYLEKIAEYKKDSYERANASSVAGAMAGGAVVGNMITAPIAGHFHRKLTKATMSHDSASDLGTIRKFMRDNNLKTTFNNRESVIDKKYAKGSYAHKASMALRNYNNPAYEAISDRIVGVRRYDGKAINHDIIMHELGHAKDYSSNKKLKLAEKLVSSHPAAKLVAAAGTGLALSNKETRDYAPLIPAAAGLATLRQEAAANHHAYKGIKAHKGALAANKFLKGVAKNNILNYSAALAGPVLGTYVAGKALNFMDGD